jgi:hypothetical protein
VVVFQNVAAGTPITMRIVNSGGRSEDRLATWP